MMDHHLFPLRHSLKQLWNRFCREASPCQTAGHMGYQIAGIFLLAVAQLTILPRVLPGSIFIDLLTPWIAISLVLQSQLRAYTLSLLAAGLLETHLSTPIGLILCPYFCFSVLILNIRNHISWLRSLSWLTLFVVFQLWLQGFMLLFYFLRDQIDLMRYLPELVHTLVNLSLSSIFGFFVVYSGGLLQLSEERHD